MKAYDTSTPRLTVDVAEAAALLGLGLGTTYQLVRSKRLGSVRAGRRVLVPVKELSAFLEREASRQDNSEGGSRR